MNILSKTHNFIRDTYFCPKSWISKISINSYWTILGKKLILSMKCLPKSYSHEKWMSKSYSYEEMTVKML